MDTPCINVCQIEPASGLCKGCGRTIAEISAWASMTPGERRHVMAGLPDRLAKAARGT